MESISLEGRSGAMGSPTGRGEDLAQGANWNGGAPRIGAILFPIPKRRAYGYELQKQSPQACCSVRCVSAFNGCRMIVSLFG